MTTHFKYIRFEIIEKKAKTGVWSCENNKHGYRLGVVKWYPGWRQYCYFSNPDVIYSKGCIDDIANFIQQLTEDRRNGNELFENASVGCPKHAYKCM